MPSKPRTKAVSPSVDDYLDALEHPLKSAVLALRKVILSIDPRIGEEVKWNAPSFTIAENFATFRLHPAPICQLVLHSGPKVRGRKTQIPIPDPDALLKWASIERRLSYICVARISLRKAARTGGAAVERGGTRSQIE